MESRVSDLQMSYSDLTRMRGYHKSDLINDRQSDAIPDSKVHGANMGPTWGRQNTGGPRVGPMNLAIWDDAQKSQIPVSFLQMAVDDQQKEHPVPDYDKQPTDFDDVIEEVGPFGPFQWRIWIIGSMFELPCAICLYFFVFGAANPGWQCVASENTTMTNWTLTSSHVDNRTPLYVQNDTDVIASCADDCTRVYNPELTSIVTEVSYIQQS